MSDTRGAGIAVLAGALALIALVVIGLVYLGPAS
jgi:hypothetical protein